MSEIKTLETKIKEAQKAYYDGNELISDAEYDALEQRLRQIDPTNAIFTSIGADTTFKKVKHIMPMGSQSKCATPEDFIKWWNEKRDVSDTYLVEPKYDGASLELQYKNGVLLRAVTRGNGEIGDDITANAKLIPGIPSKVSDNFTGGIRGEVLLTRENFEKYFQGMKNPRNAAAGTMKQKDGKNCQYLTFRAYTVFPCEVVA